MESTETTKKKVPARPKASVMVETAIKTLAEPRGSSLKAIYKYLEANYDVDIKKISTFVKKYLKAAVERGDLLQPKGKGAGGSFKMNNQKLQPKVPKVKSPKNLTMQTSTPIKVSKPKKAKFPNKKSPVKKVKLAGGAKSANKSPEKKVKLVSGEVAPADATFSIPKTEKTKKIRVSLPTKPRTSLVPVATKVNKAKKLLAKKADSPKVGVSPGGKPDSNVTSPKPAKTKAAAKTKTAKAKKSPTPGKNLIPKKAASKKVPAKDGQK